ncbi:hypothetical protein PybrP1_010572 [[Pythium] brassicae (nom. inval.)]|nr:hypothetical protein PybrP1_010572 [[Pythium] brassicae (nom. inval.)]
MPECALAALRSLLAAQRQHVVLVFALDDWSHTAFAIVSLALLVGIGRRVPGRSSRVIRSCWRAALTRSGVTFLPSRVAFNGSPQGPRSLVHGPLSGAVVAQGTAGASAESQSEAPSSELLVLAPAQSASRACGPTSWRDGRSDLERPRIVGLVNRMMVAEAALGERGGGRRGGGKKRTGACFAKANEEVGKDQVSERPGQTRHTSRSQARHEGGGVQV